MTTILNTKRDLGCFTGLLVISCLLMSATLFYSSSNVVPQLSPGNKYLDNATGNALEMIRGYEYESSGNEMKYFHKRYNVNCEGLFRGDNATISRVGATLDSLRNVNGSLRVPSDPGIYSLLHKVIFLFAYLYSK